MHETGLMRSALAMAVDQARRAGADRIHRLHLRVGALSGVIPEALQMAFLALSPGTLAEGAKLEIETVRVICKCAACDTEFEPEDIVFYCPKCGENCANMRHGREIELTSLEVSSNV
jgi:hydrogenase nickel incorporation protein HypA/HybF